MKHPPPSLVLGYLLQPEEAERGFQKNQPQCKKGKDGPEHPDEFGLIVADPEMEGAGSECLGCLDEGLESQVSELAFEEPRQSRSCQ